MKKIMEKMMRNYRMIILGVIATVISAPVFATNVWTGYYEVNYIRTYDGKTFSISLKNLQCQNAKDYFLLNQESYDRQAMVSLVMMAKAQGTRVNVRHDPNVDSTHCYISGITIE